MLVQKKKEREKDSVYYCFTILVLLFLDFLDELEGEFVSELVEQLVEELNLFLINKIYLFIGLS